jgi:uncharacterized Fe-S cluster-containing radical SAM superfamily protein
LTVFYDPVKRHLAIERLVTRTGPEGQERKYYRIRPARWYGGIVTADCVGCGLLCKFCWVSDVVMNRPYDVGSFYTPKRVADSLVTLARKCKLDLLRISVENQPLENNICSRFWKILGVKFTVSSLKPTVFS